MIYCQLCADYCVDLMIPLHVMLFGALFQLEGPLVSHVYHAVLPEAGEGIFTCLLCGPYSKSPHIQEHLLAKREAELWVS